MEPIIQQAMNDDVLRKASILYDTSFTSIKKVGGFENFVFEYEKNGQFYILRFVHSEHRVYNQVLAELEFIDYLDRNNACVSTVVHSHNDNLVEKIDLHNNHYFTVCVFKKAPGNFVKKDDLTDAFYIMFGKEVGRLHKLTKTYKYTHKRIDWYEENYSNIGRKFLPKKDLKMLDILDKLINKINNFDKNIDNYGLIHTDLHFGNMYYSSGKLEFFDWDDSSYKHFISDIAIVIFYHYMNPAIDNQEINEGSRRILALFMQGYQNENSVNSDFLNHLNDFLLLRSIILYIVLHAAGEERTNSEWGKVFLKRQRDRIYNNIPFLDLEFVLSDIKWNL